MRASKFSKEQNFDEEFVNSNLIECYTSIINA